ncbi:uncharacterized protein [Spinacia oleracea]|uniref:RNase H type-1 domain-containing protein n=1 Tax=Spinacia oleracea TaxID=3562 RepID=A0A9R0HX01_SPIOL|nr:uncharacterized protein LOC110778132 [Spinacia oleracea]
MLWSINLLPKRKLFISKLLHYGIATKANLGRRGIHVSTSCEMCNSADEDSQHLFRFCYFARDVWRWGSLAIHSNFNETMSFQEWFLFYIRLFHRQDGTNSPRIVYFVSTLWSLWMTRDKRVFRGKVSNNSGVITLIQPRLEQHSTLHNKHSLQLGFLHPLEENPIYPPGFTRVILAGIETQDPNSIILIDGSWFKVTKNSGLGWRLDREQGSCDLIIGGAQPGTSISALYTEALACLLSLRWASQAGLRRITIFTDSQRLVELLRSTEVMDVQLIWKLAGIKQVGYTFDWCIINKVDRSRVE